MISCSKGLSLIKSNNKVRKLQRVIKTVFIRYMWIGGTMKTYFCEVNKNYSIIKQIKISVVISFSLLILDILDIPSKIITKYDFPVFFLMSIAIVILIGLTIIENGLLDMFKIQSINRIDAIICVKLFSILIYTTLIYLMDELYLYKFIILGVPMC